MPGLSFDELRQVGNSGGLSLREEGRGVLLHQAIPRGLLGAVTLVVDRSALGRPVGLPSAGLQAMLRSRLGCSTIFVCDLEQKLMHANRAGHDELAAGKWVTLNEGRIELVPNTHPQRLRGELRNLLRSPPDHQSHLRWPPRDGQRAELLARWLEGHTEPPHLFLLRLVVLAQGRPAAGVEYIATVSHTKRSETDGMTKRQRELAKLLLSGGNVSEAARRMGIQRSTASDRIKGLFTLSHTTRQVDLVAWLTHVRLD